MRLRWLGGGAHDEALLRAYLELTSSWFSPPLGSRADLRTYASKLLNEGQVLAMEGNEGKIVGAVAMYCQPRDFQYAFIPYIAVSEAGKGIGKLLLREACRVCAELGSAGLEAQTALSNTRSRRLFGSCGFVETGHTDNRGTDEPSVLMRCEFNG